MRIRTVQWKSAVAPEDVSDVTGAYLAVFCPVGDDGNYYLLCTDSDVDIGVDGTCGQLRRTAIWE